MLNFIKIFAIFILYAWLIPTFLSSGNLFAMAIAIILGFGIAIYYIYIGFFKDEY